MKRCGRKAAILVGLAFVSGPYGWAMWGNDSAPVPFDRLEKNAEAYIRENPKDARGYYVLGRLHSMAFARKQQTLEVVFDGKSLPDFEPWESIMYVRTWKKEELTDEIKEHAKKSAANYGKAIELQPENAHYRLGFAWLVEEAGSLGIETVPIPKEVKLEELGEDERTRIEKLVERMGSDSPEERDKASSDLEGQLERAVPVLRRTVETADAEVRGRIENLLRIHESRKSPALEAYRKAHSLAIEGDLANEDVGPEADAMISLEAGKAIVRILKSRARSKEEEEELKRVEGNIAKLEEKGFAITPIIFPLDGKRELDDLLAPGARVSFDLDGMGPREWPWVKPDTGILVWDPRGTGKIESGRQLFGSVTWWIFWEHGYQPLDLLDDDRDGRLRGTELGGLAVWRDRNMNGVSEPGEVVPVAAAGIEAIAVGSKSGTVRCNPTGLRLANGTVLPTYDWVPVSAPRSRG